MAMDICLNNNNINRNPGADEDVLSKKRNLLISAVKNNDPVLVDRMLLDSGELITAGNGEESPLHIAAASGYDEIVLSLIKYGVDVNAKNEWSELNLGIPQMTRITPLDLAILCNKKESTARIIMDSGVLIKDTGKNGSKLLEKLMTLYVQSPDDDTQKLWLSKSAMLLSGGSAFGTDMNFFLKVNMEHKLIRNDKWWFIEMLWLCGHKFTKKLQSAKLDKLTPNPYEGYGLLERFNREPLPLKQAAANVVRRLLQPNAFVGVQVLQLPTRIRELIFVK